MRLSHQNVGKGFHHRDREKHRDKDGKKNED
jgi:hypothetical protein